MPLALHSSFRTSAFAVASLHRYIVCSSTTTSVKIREAVAPSSKTLCATVEVRPEHPSMAKGADANGAPAPRVVWIVSPAVLRAGDITWHASSGCRVQSATCRVFLWYVAPTIQQTRSTQHHHARHAPVRVIHSRAANRRSCRRCRRTSNEHLRCSWPRIYRPSHSHRILFTNCSCIYTDNHTRADANSSFSAS